MANQPKKLLSVAEAEAIVRKSGAGRKIEAVPLLEALGRVIAEDVVAPEPSPRFTNSAMDGFAVRWEDVHYAEAARPAVLTIIGESQAGAPFSRDGQSRAHKHGGNASGRSRYGSSH
jgi:molybdopterin molybdotransferase